MTGDDAKHGGLALRCYAMNLVSPGAATTVEAGDVPDQIIVRFAIRGYSSMGWGYIASQR